MWLRTSLVGMSVVLSSGMVSYAQVGTRAPQGLARVNRFVGRPASPVVNTTNSRTFGGFDPAGLRTGNRLAGFSGRFHGPGGFNNFNGVNRFSQFNQFGRMNGFGRVGNRFNSNFNPCLFNSGVNDPRLASQLFNSNSLTGNLDPRLLLTSGLDPTLYNQLALLSGLNDFNSTIAQGDLQSMIGGAGQANAQANQVQAAGMYNLTTGLGRSAQIEAQSNMVRAQGEFNLDTSQSMIHQAQARSAHIDNQQKSAQTYYSVKRMHDEYAQARTEREKIPIETHMAIARANVPRPLSPGQLDPVTGRITWPEPLLEPEYALYRQQLEQLFELRMASGGGSGTTRRIRELTEEMNQELRKYGNELPGNDYAMARRFIESLAYTVRPAAG